MKTFSAKPLEIDRKWYVIDADGATLGRVAVEAANILRGKNKPQYTPSKTKPQQKSPVKSSKTSSSERVRVTSPDGQVGTIPKNNLLEALKEGYKLLKDAAK